MSGTRYTLALLLSLSVTSAVASLASAQTRTEVLRWEDTVNDDVTSYRVYWGTTSRSYTQSQDAGIPPKSGEAYEFAVQVDADAQVYFAVTALNATSESFFSNERCRTPSGDCASAPPPPPPSPPPSGEAQGAVIGFALWNAGNSTLLDGDFRSGEAITAGSPACVAIEILTNSYLNGSGPGSIKKVFDGVDPGACDDPGTTHENNAPFAWEADAGPGSFDCASSLTQPGAHTLSVTPFDGDDCTGAQGATQTLQFSVVGEGEPPPPPVEEQLGQPGQPKLVNP